MSITEARAQALETILATKWPDGSRVTNLTRRTVEMIVQELEAAGLLAALPETPPTDDREAIKQALFQGRINRNAVYLAWSRSDDDEPYPSLTEDEAMADAVLAWLNTRRPSPPTEEQTLGIRGGMVKRFGRSARVTRIKGAWGYWENGKRTEPFESREAAAEAFLSEVTNKAQLDAAIEVYRTRDPKEFAHEWMARVLEAAARVGGESDGA